ncbi:MULTISPECIES: DUF2231 domain-containing protein [unclassified Nocardioides]|jgi:hypothetical protein|uniref:DUF2231 domain-containing protein n=1 Tax=Nocardioides sp. URHA0032 TaxID=1380388 RepID=UPI0004911C41|nr:DUF2231 domain-containing protein [Nocardioides sp. URHA0032]
MPSTFFGLPLHPLIVHATVVMVPLAVLAVLGAVLVPRFRRWAGPLPMGLSLVALVLTPLSTASGENLEHSLPETRLIEQHAELGDQLIWFTVALFVFAAAYWWLDRRRTATPEAEQSRDRMRTLTAVVAVLAVLTALGTGVQVARIGHSGAKAAWSGTGSAGG